jgi:hypothetical protein
VTEETQMVIEMSGASLWLLGLKQKQELPAVKVGYQRETATGRALYKRREHQDMRSERTLTAERSPATGRPGGRSVTGWLPESLLARAEHLAQLAASLAVFATARIKESSCIVPVQSVNDQCFTGKDTWIVAYLPTQYQLHELFNTDWIFMVGIAGKGRKSCYVCSLFSPLK